MPSSSPQPPTDASAAPSRWSRTWAQWTAFAVTVALVELAIAAAPPVPSAFDRGDRFYPPTRVPNVEESTIQWQLDRLRREAADIVIIGDSSAMMGLEPMVFEQATGLDVQNYATVSWLHTEGHADVLDAYLRFHGPPRAVVYQMGTLVHVYPHEELLAGGLLDNFRRWMGLTRASWPIPMPSLSLRDLARDTLEGDHYPAQYTDAVRGREPSDTYVREWLERHSGMNVDHAPRADWASLPPLQATYQPTIESGLVRIFEQGDAHGFPVFVLHNPIPEHFRDPARDAEYTAVEERVLAVAERYESASVIGPFARYLPTELFANFEHLTREGARQNSIIVAPIIAGALGIELPSEPPPVDGGAP